MLLSAEELVSSTVSFTPRISIVGVGGAGNNLLSHAIGEGINPTRCVAVNTDRGQLSRSLALNKVLLDGAIPEEGDSFQRLDSRKMLQLSAHRVRPFTEASDITIVLAGLGGVTATGTAPLIAQWTRTPIHHVLSVVAIPFIHERERRFVALRGLKHMVEACECTVVIDNALDDGRSHPNERQADEKAFLAIHCLSELVSAIEPELASEALRIVSMGQIAVTCSAKVHPNGTVQSAVIDALRSPSAGLPLAKAKGAILLYLGQTGLGDGEAALAYEALESLIGRSIDFLHVNIGSNSEPIVCLLLTGYDYGTAVNAFVDFIEDLYDVEYGPTSSNSSLGMQIPLFQMEQDHPF